ncbi:MAG: hypothetical protein MHMPM18_002161 [Marteilia pararefringens]
MTNDIEILLDDQNFTKRPIDMMDLNLRVIESKVNGLKCTLVSDASASLSSIAICVGRGGSNENNDIPGMAHFVEHVLFMGTKSYPNPNAYNEFITQNGGSSNAYTTYHETNYYHAIDSGKFEESVKMLMSNLTEPLLGDEYLYKEADAVNSEYEGLITQSQFKINSATADFIEPDNDILKFIIGSSDTLKSNNTPQYLSKKAREFFTQNYCLKNMTMCLYGSQSLEELQNIFKNHCNSKDKNDISLIVPEVEGKLPKRLSPEDIILNINVTKQIDRLDYFYMFEKQNEENGQAIASLMNDTKEGSLYHLLYKNDYLTYLNCKVSTYTRKFRLFTLTIGLTNKGFANYQIVNGVVRDYIKFLRNIEIPDYIFNDWRLAEELNFLCLENSTPCDLTSLISSNMHFSKNPGNYLIDRQFDNISRKGELEFLNDLNFTKSGIVSLTSDKFGTDKLKCYDKYSKTFYDSIKLESTALPDNLKNKFSLPLENKYLKKCDFTKPPKHSKIWDYSVTSLDDKNSGLKSFSVVEDRFRKNMQHIRIKFLNYKIPDTIENLFTSRIVLNLLSDHLEVALSDANKANISFDIKRFDFGFQVRISGISDIIPKFVEDILQNILSFSFERSQLDSYIEDVTKNVKNYKSRKPSRLSMSEFYNSFKTHFKYSIDEKLQFIDELPRLDYTHFLPNFFENNCQIKLLLFGNSLEQNIKYHDLIDSQFKKHKIPLIPCEMPEHFEKLEMDLSKSPEYVFAVKRLVITNDLSDNVNNCLVASYMSDRSDYSTKVKLDIYSRLFGEKFFDEKRSQKQLGYVVGCGSHEMMEHSFIYFIIEGTKSPELFENEIVSFVEESCKKLQNLTDQEFEDAVDSQISVYKYDPCSSSNDIKEIHSNFCKNRYSINQECFENTSHILHNLKQIKKKEFVDFILEMLISSNRRLVISTTLKKNTGVS